MYSISPMTSNQVIADQPIYFLIVTYDFRYYSKKETEALRLVGTPVGNASTSTFKGNLQYYDSNIKALDNFSKIIILRIIQYGAITVTVEEGCP